MKIHTACPHQTLLNRRGVDPRGRDGEATSGKTDLLNLCYAESQICFSFQSNIPEKIALAFWDGQSGTIMFPLFPQWGSWYEGVLVNRGRQFFATRDADS